MNSGMELVIENPDRKWELVAEDAKTASRWMRAIANNLKSAFGVELPDDLDWGVDEGTPLKAAW